MNIAPRPAVSADGASPRVGPARTGERFHSILFERGDAGADLNELHEPDFFSDLNLDQLLQSITAGREEYQLTTFFYAPLHDVDAVEYRHEVFHDLEKRVVLEPIDRFAEAMRAMREHLVQVRKLHDRLQKQAWLLDAIGIYCQAVRALTDELQASTAASRGLRRLRTYLGDYARGEPFTVLESETHALKDALARIQYAVRIHGARVTVTRYDGETDYSAEVEQTFAKFKQGAVTSYLVNPSEFADMNHVESQIVALVAKLYPDVFRMLDDYCERHRDYVDETIGRFDREVQVYLAYIGLIERLKNADLPVCYPQVSTESKQLTAEDSYDIALANKLVPDRVTVVTNDMRLDGPERLFVVSGPNNGGKTTFARTFGQLHYLAGLGLPVPGRSARIFLPDRVFTHFEKEEDITTLRGKFDDELVRVHDILENATGNSVIVMNESFSSTSLNDALFVGTEVVRRVLDLDCLGMYVTFVDEIASLTEATVSMVSQIVPDNPAERTFKVLRRPANGLAYAWALAQKYGLTFDRLLERIA